MSREWFAGNVYGQIIYMVAFRGCRRAVNLALQETPDDERETTILGADHRGSSFLL